MEVITRKQALSANLRYYFTGKPCIKGHVCEKETRYGKCVECRRISASKVREIRKDCSLSYNKENERKREYYKLNRGIILAKKKLWREENKDSNFIRRSIERLNSNVNFGSTDYTHVLGYSRGDLRRHISSLFSEGMSWDNYGDWHIDHIKPISTFIKEGITDVKLVNALINLQPLWAKDNLSKGSTW